jgi:DNA repair exonuclease SbcCD ATPase subunit
MLRRNLAIVGVALALLGCDRAREEHKEAQRAELEAQKEINEAVVRAEKKIDEANRELAEEKAEAVDAMNKQKADYRDRIEAELKRLDDKLTDWTVGVERAADDKKAESEAAFRDVIARRDTLRSDLDRLNAAGTSEWLMLKAQLDKSLDEFKKSYRTASSRIKTVPKRDLVKTDKSVPNAP